MRTIWGVIFIAVTLLSTSIVSHAQQSTENKKIQLKVNLGGGPVSDFLGEDQVLDMSDFSKNVAKVKIQNTDQAEIFQTTRFARATDMTFRIPVPTGIYSLTLLFAEGFRPACTPGGRVFDIHIGTPVSGVTKIVDGFDLFQNAGCQSAHGKRFNQVPSKDGIVVHLVRRAQHPALAGFIVEGFPQPVGDGSEYKAIGRLSTNSGGNSSPAGPDGVSSVMSGTAEMAGTANVLGNGGEADSQSAVSGSYGAAAAMAMEAPPMGMMRMSSRRLASVETDVEVNPNVKPKVGHSTKHKQSIDTTPKVAHNKRTTSKAHRSSGTGK